MVSHRLAQEFQGRGGKWCQGERRLRRSGTWSQLKLAVGSLKPKTGFCCLVTAEGRLQFECILLHLK